MFFAFVASILIFCLLLLFFLSRRLSPVPYYPTNKKDLPLIAKAMRLHNSQIIADLGAGNGRVLFYVASEAYKSKLKTAFIGVEINPILILILHIRRFFHPNRKNIKILWADIFKYDYSQLIANSRKLITVYMYISPWLQKRLLKQISRGVNVVLISYYYPIQGLKIRRRYKKAHQIFTYNFS